MLPPVTADGTADGAAGGADRPLWIVCEDGTEYLERFARFLGGEFRFAAAADAGALIEALAGGEVTGVILDRDFRRAPRERLVDENGRTDAQLPEAGRRRLSADQGIFILRHLRAKGIAVPALLCADIEDAGQAAYLERTLAPLQIVPSHEGLRATAARMRQVSGLSA